MSLAFENAPAAVATAKPMSIKLRGTQPATAPLKPNKPPTGQKPSVVTTKIGVWELQSGDATEIEPPENTESLFNGTFTAFESVIGGDGRKPVPKKQLMPGGKYRAIVKLFLRFAGQPEGSAWAMATGWLIESDLLVTAGHCAFDRSHNYGRLTHVKAYIGYTGKDAVKDSNLVQLRVGVRAAAPETWLQDGPSNSSGDVSFIRLDKPFTGVTPFKYLPTPSRGTNEVIGVVGYPGDLMKSNTGEKGALMYEMFQPTNYAVGGPGKMLQYTVDTYGGNSGSPVLRKSDLASIGVHVLGGNPNSASLISGKYGNPFDALKTAIKQPGKGFRWISTPKTADAAAKTGPQQQKTGAKKGSGEALEPEFKHESIPELNDKTRGETGRQLPSDLVALARALSKAKKVTMDPLGTIAAYGLHVAGMQARQFRTELEHEQGSGEDVEATRDGAGQDDDGSVTVHEDSSSSASNVSPALDATHEYIDEADVDGADAEEATPATDAAYEGVAERAMLTEAAYLTFLALKTGTCEKLGYLDKISSYVAKYTRTCGKAGTVVFPTLMAPALRATIARARRQTNTPDTEADTDPAGTFSVASLGGFGPRLDPNRESVIEELSTTSDDAGTEAFAHSINTIVSKGLRIPGPIIARVASMDLADLVQRTSSLHGAEAALEAALEDESTDEYLYDAMAQRALIGEAMLEAILSTPADVQREEGIFSWIKKGLKLVAGVMSEETGGQEESWWSIAKGLFRVGKAIYTVATENAPVDSEDPEPRKGEEDQSEDGDDWDTFIQKHSGPVAAET